VSFCPDVPDTDISFLKRYSSTMLPVSDVKIYLSEWFFKILKFGHTRQIILA